MPFPRKIRVAHCIETVHLGGVEQTRLTLAKGLQPDRFEQILICTKALGALPDQFREAGCPVKTIGVFRSRVDWQSLARARRHLREFRPDIVHGGVYEGVITAALAGKIAGVPIIIGEETSEPAGRRWSGHLFLRALTTLTDRMIGVSPHVRDYLVNSLRIPSSKVVLVNNGVIESPSPTRDEVADLRRALGLRGGSFVIGTVGRLFDSHKKTSDVIRALPALLKEMPAARLLIVGEGPDQPMLESLATSLGVSEQVTFAGYQPHTRPFFELMDIFVHVPASEAFGLVLVEAMFARKPVVASSVGGIPTVVADGETGVLIPSGDPVRLSRELLRLAADPERRRAMGEAGFTKARAEFSQARYVDDIDRLYTQLVESHGGAR